MYENCKIYGPYESKQYKTRLFIVIVFPDGLKKTMSYPKYIVEIKLNRYLTEMETVHHIDGNPLNNDLSNLTIINRHEHIKLDAIKRIGKELVCQWCGNTFYVEGKKLHQRERKDNKCNSFCSKRCTGKYGKYVQNGGKKFNRVEIDKDYEKELYTGNSIDG